MSQLGGHSLLNPVDRTWQAFREAVLAHPGISGAKFDHATKRADLMTEKTVVPSRRRISATLVVDADGTRVVISGVGTRGRTHQIATELLADVDRRLGASAPDVPDDDPLSTLPAPTASGDLPPPTVVPAQADVPSDRTPRTPPAPPPPPSVRIAPPLPTPPTRRTSPAHDALSELADTND